ncbi:PatB family C-S lyase [Sulfurimonas marina]|uniref:cysteine-S-conjugate beta-lyase n=1 Tax=Sulfurimonas marina TaxID=2590551 RepID=A0A7M1ATC6_9BACT|nr:PatB family C-S lyase [Sulfurimonas marina]QOP40669.1 putative C-S lyase [Sulfurimonas marina]
MSYDFTSSADRSGSNAEKYSLREELFGTEDVLPAWVADMDIDTPDFVLESVKKRLVHPVIGYEEFPKSAFKAQIRWMKKHHGVEYDLEEMFYSHSVVASMQVVIEAFSNKGDEVIVQTPIYPPFFHAPAHMERKVVKNPLMQLEDGTYTFDLEDLKAKITDKTKLLLLSSPHNPVGRVWTKEELEALLEICRENNIIIFADEVHCDLVYEPNKHIPLASLEGAKERVITAIGVGKTFNMAGFAVSSIVVPKNLRDKFKKAYDNVHFAQGSVLSHVAFESAYNNGEEWLKELKIHLYKNYMMLSDLADRYKEYIELTPIEGTYLAWLDCRKMDLNNKVLREWFVKEAKLGLNAGLSFGKEGSGFMRLNFAVSSAKMAQIITQLQNALQRMKTR